MLTFKQFINKPLNEALDNKQIKQVKKWTPSTNDHLKFSNHAMDNQDRVHVPLEHPTLKSKHADAIHKHLESHGFTPHDYKAGLVKDKYGRETKIGGALIKTKAPPEMLKDYNTDPSRVAAKKSDMHVVISRHPHDVAGMSTNRSWDSCMNMDGGINKKCLKHDIEHGSHVAYLAHKDDHNLDHPIAKVTLKPFVHKESGDTILRPDIVSYGNGGTAFDHTVRKWTEDKFPLKHTVYKKNPKVYSDDNNSIALSTDPKHIDDLVNHKDDKVRQTIARHPKLKDHHIDKLVNDKDDYVRQKIARNPKLKEHHIDKLINDKDDYVKSSVSENPNLKDHHIDKLLDDKSLRVKYDIARNPKLKEHHIDKLINSNDLYIGENPNIKEHHIDKLINHENHIIRRSIAHNPNLKDHHIDKLVNDKHSFVRSSILRNPKLKNYHVNKLSNDENDNIRNMAKEHPLYEKV